jgi:hypothetical protein
LPAALTAYNIIVYAVDAARAAEDELTVVTVIGEVVVPADLNVEPLSVE